MCRSLKGEVSGMPSQCLPDDPEPFRVNWPVGHKRENTHMPALETADVAKGEKVDGVLDGQ